MPTTTPIRKRVLDPSASAAPAADEIDIARGATIHYSSERPSDPVDHLFDSRPDTGWVSARPDTTETIVLEFDRPQDVSRLVYEVEEVARDRTQEVRVDVSEDGGRSYRQIVVQEYNFSPRGATREHQDLHFGRCRATHLRLTIVPNKNGCGTATLTSLRLFAPRS